MQAILDTKAEVNVITKAVADKLRLPVCTDLLLVLKAVLGDTRVFDRACKNVEIDIRSVVNYQTLLVLNKSEHTLIFETPFFYNTQVMFEYDNASNQYAQMLSKDYEKVATVWVCALQSRKDKESRETRAEGKE